MQDSLFEPQFKNFKKAVNVSSVPQRSPFRYPGGKTWLIPVIRKWLKQNDNVNTLLEPFAGGGIVSLTAAFENLAKKVVMVELDEEIAAVWQVIFGGNGQKLAEKILNFNLNTQNVNLILESDINSLEDKAFRTILKNRVFHGGILASGAGKIKNGENGKGINSRWYPKTLYNRISSMNHISQKVNFIKGDGFDTIKNYISNIDAYFFIDPPYTLAGRRLYNHHQIDHDKLFQLCSVIKGKFLLTYDESDEVKSLAKKYSLETELIPMKTTHHIQKNELLISDNFNWFN
jgi:DNA adenine methylase